MLLRQVPREGPIPVSLDLEYRFARWRSGHFKWKDGVVTTPIKSGHLVQQYVVDGQLDVDALQEALAAVVRRHEVLRTGFTWYEDNPEQLINNDARLDLVYRDVSKKDSTARNELLESELASLYKPFDVVDPPLMRASLIRHNDERHVLLIAIDHLIADGWSMKVLHRDLSDAYNSVIAGQQLQLPDLPIQFADYAVCQREHLTGDELSRQIHYWRNQLDGEVPSFKLPADFPRSEVQTSKGSSLAIPVSSELFRTLRLLAQRAKVTPFVVYLAALKCLLFSIGRESRVVVTTSLARRDAPECINLVGPLYNFAFLVSEVFMEQTFLDLVLAARDACAGAVAHQDVPVARVLEGLRHESCSIRKQANVYLDIHSQSGKGLLLNGLRIAQRGRSPITALFDMSFWICDDAKHSHVRVVFRDDLFRRDTAKRILAQYTDVLEKIASDPFRRVAELV